MTIYEYLKDKFNIEVKDYVFKRDYIMNPLKRIDDVLGKPFEEPYKEDLEYLYIKLNLTRNDICKYIFHFNASLWKKIVKKFNIRKTTKNIYKNIKKTCLKKYGVENYTQTDDWHNRMLELYNGKYPTETNEFKNKSKQTKLERYGNETYTNVEQIKQTKLEKYGDSGYNNFEKTKQTNLKKYGKEYLMGTNEFIYQTHKTKENLYGDPNYTNKEQRNNTMKQRYGTIYALRIGKEQSSYNIVDDREKFVEYIKSNNIKSVQELSNKLGINMSSLNKFINRYNLRNMFDYHGSFAEKEIQDYIRNKYDIVCNTRNVISPYELDIFIPQLNKAIEYNGNYWHNYNFFPEKKERDDLKNKLCQEKGIKLLTIWEQEYKLNKNAIIEQIDNFLKL